MYNLEFLEKSNLGLNVYYHIIGQFIQQGQKDTGTDSYSNESVNQAFLPFNEVDCKVVPNPFNGGKNTLKLKIIDGCASHEDTEKTIPPGDVFDFAEMYYGKTGAELIDFLTIELGLDNSERQPHGTINMSQGTFSFYSNPITNTVPNKVVGLQDIYELITGDKYIQRTNELRSISDSKEAKRYKAQQFDYVTFSGVFSERSEKKLQQHSGLLVLDFDHLPNIDTVKQLLLHDPCIETAMLFTSPSGDGIKWVVPIDVTNFSHQNNFIAIASYIQHTYQLEVDASGKDVSRACFLPHDSGAYMKRNNDPNLKRFDVESWLPKLVEFPVPETVKVSSSVTYGNEAWDEVISVLNEIEAKHIDITKDYSNWVRIGFAFAATFGENGRELFHRVSKIHPNYSHEECDKQYGHCLQSKGNGVSLATFFYLAKNEGVNIGNTSLLAQPDDDELPRFSPEIFDKLPVFLQKICSNGSDQQQKDMLLLGSIVTLSSCLSSVHGIYDGKKVHPNLFLFVVGAASAGKGNLTLCRNLVYPIHAELRAKAKQYKQLYELSLKKMKGKNPFSAASSMEPPREWMLIIPANNSSTGAYQILGDNDGIGLIFETEADTLTKSFNSDFGDYSDGFRRAFQHEPITYFRRTGRELVEIERPRLSTLISGTPHQVFSLLPNTENGLYSRFMFYIIELNPQWRDVFAEQTDNDAYFKSLGEEFMKLYRKLKNNEVCFKMSESQQEEFSAFFNKKQAAFMAIYGEQFLSIIRRYGLMTYRFAMVLSSIRLVNSLDIPKQLECSEHDLQVALSMADVLFEHNTRIYRRMPQGALPHIIPNLREQFLSQLPQEFDRATYLQVASKLNIKAKTAEKWIKRFVDGKLIMSPIHNSYFKLTH